jgi:hypothetical protein
LEKEKKESPNNGQMEELMGDKVNRITGNDQTVRIPSRKEKNHYGREGQEGSVVIVSAAKESSRKINGNIQRKHGDFKQEYDPRIEDSITRYINKTGNGRRKKRKKDEGAYLKYINSCDQVAENEGKQNCTYQMYGCNITSDLNGSRELRSKNLDCECLAQAIDRHSTVDAPCAAAERKDMNKNHIGRQIQDVECILLFCDGKTCLLTETDSETSIEEANQLIRSEEAIMGSVSIGYEQKNQFLRMKILLL